MFPDTEWKSAKLRVELLHLSANRLISIPHSDVCECACVCVRWLGMTGYHLITTLRTPFLAKLSVQGLKYNSTFLMFPFPPDARFIPILVYY